MQLAMATADLHGDDDDGDVHRPLRDDNGDVVMGMMMNGEPDLGMVPEEDMGLGEGMLASPLDRPGKRRIRPPSRLDGAFTSPAKAAASGGGGGSRGVVGGGAVTPSRRGVSGGMATTPTRSFGGGLRSPRSTPRTGGKNGAARGGSRMYGARSGRMEDLGADFASHAPDLGDENGHLRGYCLTDDDYDGAWPLQCVPRLYMPWQPTDRAFMLLSCTH